MVGTGPGEHTGWKWPTDDGDEVPGAFSHPSPASGLQCGEAWPHHGEEETVQKVKEFAQRPRGRGGWA